MGKFSFMHLVGMGGRSRMDDDPEDKRDDGSAEEDEDLRKSKKAENDEDDQKESKADNEDDNGDPDVSEDDEEEKARASERHRCAAIFATPYAAKNPALAAELAFNTRMSVKQARAVMEAAVAGGVSLKGGLATRMLHVPQPETGRDIRPAPTEAHAMAQHAMKLYNEATGGKAQ
ncbi:TPA: hypothetical protein U0V61_005053 [Escherichia coli]|nr:hypothetical protein [Escherichia coli]MED8844562.1 hypothetical protein [Escherichia coli]MED9368270.1 hypothetical protein [Escherichia coli]MED9701669.1 hypothetical protein [Escherichia coli]HAY0218978.1 hypothetical protein [Escherichia coli]